MEIQKVTQFIDDVTSDDFECGPYKNDVVLILSQNEIDELHTALTEWIMQNNIVRVQTVGHINNDIRIFLEEMRNDEGGK